MENVIIFILGVVVLFIVGLSVYFTYKETQELNNYFKATARRFPGDKK